MRAIDSIKKRIKSFKTKTYPKLKNVYQDLKDTHKPIACLVTCSDARIDPSLIKQANPGEIFTIRTAGNIVPYNSKSDGTLASIEYAVRVLQVRDIILMGHSDCGAMKAMVHANSGIDELDFAIPWLESGQITSKEIKRLHSDNYQLEDIVKYNVLRQVKNLNSYSFIEESSPDLAIHPWYYDIGNGEVQEYSFEEQVWQSIS